MQSKHRTLFGAVMAVAVAVVGASSAVVAQDRVEPTGSRWARRQAEDNVPRQGRLGYSMARGRQGL